MTGKRGGKGIKIREQIKVDKIDLKGQCFSSLASMNVT